MKNETTACLHAEIKSFLRTMCEYENSLYITKDVGTPFSRLLTAFGIKYDTFSYDTIILNQAVL